MIKTVVSRITGILVSPAGTFRSARDDPGKILAFCLLLTVCIHSLLSSILIILQNAPHPFFLLVKMPVRSVLMVNGAVTFIALLVSWLFLIAVWGIWVNLWAYLSGGKKGIGRSMTAVIYGTIPLLLTGWIPLLGLAGLVWSLALWLTGIRELHGISTGRAAVALALAIISGLALATILFGWDWISALTYGLVIPA
jgi:hypothetical protein